MITLALLLAAFLLPQGEAQEGASSMPVTLQQCIYLAEKNSLSLRMSEIDVQIGKAQVGSALGKFDTIAFLDGSYDKNTSPETSFLAQGNFAGFGTPQGKVIVVGILTKTWQASAGFKGQLLTGGSYQADVNWSKRWTEAGTFGGYNPEYRSDVGLSLTQPLLRGFGTTVAKKDILAARNNLRGTAQALEEGRILRAAEVISAYWEFYFARRNVATRAFFVEQAEKLVRIKRKRLEVGDATRLDVVEAESNLATRQQELIKARNEIDRTLDELKRLIFPFDEQAEWDLELVPLTEASEERVEPSAWQEAAAVALERRPELLKRREWLKNNDLEILVAENAILPRLDLTGTARLNHLSDSRSDSLDFSDDYRHFSAGVSFEMPIGNRSARYNLSVARLEKIKALLEYKDVENDIIQQVRDGVRNVANRKEEIDAASEAVRLAAERWRQEQTRQEVGFSTTFQARDAEAQWQEALDAELRALFEYQIALASLDAAQGTLLERYGILPAPPPLLDDRAGVFFDS